MEEVILSKEQIIRRAYDFIKNALRVCVVQPTGIGTYSCTLGTSVADFGDGTTWVSAPGATTGVLTFPCAVMRSCVYGDGVNTCTFQIDNRPALQVGTVPPSSATEDIAASYTTATIGGVAGATLIVVAEY